MAVLGSRAHTAFGTLEEVWNFSEKFQGLEKS